MLEVEVLKVGGYEEALYGLGLNFGSTSNEDFYRFVNNGTNIDNLANVAGKLAGRGHGHDKYLRQIVIWAKITAPRFWWSEFDTYKVGTVAQSESTMHTIHKRLLTKDDFDEDTTEEAINNVNRLISKNANVHKIKANLPEGFLQTRVVTLNYAVVFEIVRQRKTHKLKEWRMFCVNLIDSIAMHNFFKDSEIIKKMRLELEI